MPSRRNWHRKISCANPTRIGTAFTATSDLKAVGDADLVAALKAREEVLKNAKPAQLASKDLVRKSHAYWDRFHSDFRSEGGRGRRPGCRTEGSRGGLEECQAGATGIERSRAQIPRVLGPLSQRLPI